MTDSRPLDVPAVYSLYLGALELEADRRVPAAATILLAARAGVAPTEIEHLEDSWVDRDRMALTIPPRSSCECPTCAERDGNWTPPANRASRTIPVGYSRRLSGLLDALIEMDEPIDTGALIDDAATAATGLDADRVDGERLARTGVQFFVDLGLDRGAIERLVGTNPWQVPGVTRRPDAETAAGLYRETATDRPPAVDPDEAFPLACDPTAFEDEPIDPTDASAPTIGGPFADGLAGAEGDLGRAVRRADQRRHGGPDPTPAATASEPEPATSPEELLTKPLVANVTARFVSDALDREGVCEGRILLGQEQLLAFTDTASAAFDDADTERLLIPLEGVSDVGFDYVPSELSADFESSIAIAHRHGDDQHVLLIELAASKQYKFRSVLFRLLFNVTPADVANPISIDGSDTGESAAEMMLYVRPNEIKFGTPTADAREFTVPLDNIVHVERDHEYIETDKRRVLYISYLIDNRMLSAMVALRDDRLQTLFERFLKRSLQDELNDVEGLRLSEGERDVLAALAGVDERSALPALLDIDGDRLESIVETLAAKSLVEVGDSGTALTGRGYLAAMRRTDADE
ncbi:MAG: CheF family chemotaxis protein [Halococcoides sp.]